jgi:SAM-dependent methyltransferase
LTSRLARSFDAVAELYERARPSYPAGLFDDLGSFLGAGASVLEIGCGTGKATVPLAARGFRLTCVELGPRLAQIARRNLEPFRDAEVVVADFDRWEPRGRFDAAVAFTAFHWLDPRTRYARCAAALRDGGVLAVATTQHVLPAGGDDFFRAVQEDYEAVLPDDPATKRGGPGPPEAATGLAAEMEASGRFRHEAQRRHLWDVVYSADEYLAVLATYSGNRALDPEVRQELFERIRRRIEARPGGRVRKTYLALLDVARRT